MNDVVSIANAADMIINGYAFIKSENHYRVLNLHAPDRAVVLSESGEVIETSMDDIEIGIVKDYLQKNKQFM